MGVVHTARDLRSDCLVAVKVLRRELVDDPSFVARFRREATIARALHHRNIGRLLDYGCALGRHYIVMELILGCPLSEVMAAPMDSKLAVDICAQLLYGLAHAHDSGLIHRDLKPDNVILERSERGVVVARIVDFGISIRREQAESQSGLDRLTGAGQILGTPEFMAPEQARGERMDERVDLFALGIMFFAMLTGTMPYPGKGLQVTLANMTTPTPRMRTRAPNVKLDPLLEKFTRWLMQKAPSARPRSAGEAREVLRLIHTDRTAAELRLDIGSETRPIPPHLLDAAQFLPDFTPVGVDVDTAKLKRNPVHPRVVARTRKSPC